MEVREATRKQFWRKAQQLSSLDVEFNLNVTNSSLDQDQTAEIDSKAAGSVVFWASLNKLMTPSGTSAARVKMKDDEIFSRPNTKGVCIPMLKPTTKQEQYLLRVYRTLCHACHLHESSPSALFLTQKVLIKARTNMKRNVPKGAFVCVCALI